MLGLGIYITDSLYFPLNFIAHFLLFFTALNQTLKFCLYRCHYFVFNFSLRDSPYYKHVLGICYFIVHEIEWVIGKCLVWPTDAACNRNNIEVVNHKELAECPWPRTLGFALS